MEPFQIDIFEVKPVIVYALRGQIDLHSGKADIAEIPKGEDLIFERIHQTPKSKLTFKDAERREGILYFYFIAFDNEHSYLYIIGQTNNRPIIRGGGLIEVEAEDAEDVGSVVAQYVGNNAKKLSDMYKQKESPALINSLNKAVEQIYNLIP